VTDRSIGSDSSVAPVVPWRPARGRGRLSSPRVLFVVVLALVLSSGTLMSTTTKAAQAKIKTDWVTFFSGTTPTKTKIALLQNGKSFAAVISSQAKGNPLASSAAAKVSAVTLTSATKATVRYTITIGGQPALSNQKGVVVLQGGTWKVGDQSFCALLALEQTKTPACPGK
jgi:hypothetical protein